MTTRADRRGPACESRPARKSPDFGPTRGSAFSGDIVGEVRKSGFRDPVRTSWGASIGFRRCVLRRLRRVFQKGFRRRRGPEIDRLRRPAGARIRKSAISGDIVGDIRESGSRQDVMGGSIVARLQKVSGDNGARKLTNCADRRGPASESRPAHKSPDFGPTRRSAISGDTVGEIRKSGFRDPVRMSCGGGLLGSGGAFCDVSVARCTGGFRRQRGPEVDHWRRPAGARI